MNVMNAAVEGEKELAEARSRNLAVAIVKLRYYWWYAIVVTGQRLSPNELAEYEDAISDLWRIQREFGTTKEGGDLWPMSKLVKAIFKDLVRG